MASAAMRRWSTGRIASCAATTPQISDRLLQNLDGEGSTSLRVTLDKVEKQEDARWLIYLNGRANDPIAADLLLFATGRLPTPRSGARNAGVELDENGAVRVDADGNRSTCDSMLCGGRRHQSVQ